MDDRRLFALLFSPIYGSIEFLHFVKMITEGQIPKTAVADSHIAVGAATVKLVLVLLLHLIEGIGFI